MASDPKICFIVSSSIKVNNEYPIDTWNETPRRSDFDTDERYMQTIYTLVNLRTISKNSKIFLVDTSLDYTFSFENYFDNVKCWSLQQHNKDIAEFVNKSSVKSLCEAMLINEFIKQNREELLTYDYIVKVSGRYVIELHVEDLIKNKFMFTRKYEYPVDENVEQSSYYMETAKMCHNGIDNWVHSMYPSTVYAFDSSFLWKVEKILEDLIKRMSEDDNTQMLLSMETYLYNGTRDISEFIEIIPMRSHGFAGISKRHIWV